MTITREFPSLGPFGSEIRAYPAGSRPERERDRPRDEALSRAETAECTCPDFCERDHGND